MTDETFYGEKLPMLLNLSSLDLIAIAFVTFNGLRLVSYFPQIVAVARDRNGANAISLSCWTIWIGANASTGIYAWVKLDDANLAAVSAFNAGCCLVVLLLAAYKRFLAQRFGARGVPAPHLVPRLPRPWRSARVKVNRRVSSTAEG